MSQYQKALKAKILDQLETLQVNIKGSFDEGHRIPSDNMTRTLAHLLDAEECFYK